MYLLTIDVCGVQIIMLPFWCSY